MVEVHFFNPDFLCHHEVQRKGMEKHCLKQLVLQSGEADGYRTQ